jgi:hypothetical protein
LQTATPKKEELDLTSASMNLMKKMITQRVKNIATKSYIIKIRVRKRKKKASKTLKLIYLKRRDRR